MTNTSRNKLIIICFSLIVLITLFIIIANKKTHVVTHKANNPEHFTTSDGTQINYLIYPAKHAKGTLLWLHGDGAAEFYEPDTKYYLEGPHGIKQAAAAHQLTLIVPKTPSKDKTWWTNGEQNNEYLVELIRTLPDHDNLWIGSFSGGSEEVAYWLLHDLKKAGVQRGGAVLFGGGGSPKSEGITDTLPKSDVIQESFPLTWIAGEHDDSTDKYAKGFNTLKKSKESEAFYRSQGWDTKRIVLEGYGHLISNDDEGLYGKYLDDVLNGKRDEIKSLPKK